MTSSIFPPRSAFAPCSPSTHAIASTTLLLPEPLGPTTQVRPGSRASVVVPAKDLNPRRVRLLRYIPADASGHGAQNRGGRPEGVLHRKPGPSGPVRDQVRAGSS